MTLEASVEKLHGICSVCTHKKKHENFTTGIFATGKCAVCKFAHTSMYLSPNSIEQDQDNWEWEGYKGEEVLSSRTMERLAWYARFMGMTSEKMLDYFKALVPEYYATIEEAVDHIWLELKNREVKGGG